MTERAYTERDLMLAKRTAYRHGAETWAGKTSSSYGDFIDAVHSSAARQYPLPKITRARVVTDSAGTEWRMVGERLEFRSVDNWHPYLGGAAGYDIGDGFYGTCLRPTPERIKIWAGLLANPNESVEDV